MKNKLDQIKFIDKALLPIFGIKSIIDYKTEISVKTLKKDTDFLNRLNNELGGLKDNFPVREFSLNKSDGKIKTLPQAFGLLKKCLQLANVLFEINNRSNTTYLRLIPKNFILDNYIKHIEMSDICDYQVNSESCEQAILYQIKDKKTITYEELVNGVKKRITSIFISPLQKLLTIETGEPVITLSPNKHHFLQDNIGKLGISFQSKQINGIDIVDRNLIDKLFADCQYSVLFGGERFEVLDGHFNNSCERLNVFDNTVMPLKMAPYIYTDIKIFPNQGYNIKEFAEFLQIKFVVETVVFKKALDIQLPGLLPCVSIPFGVENEDKQICLLFCDGVVKPQVVTSIYDQNGMKQCLSDTNNDKLEKYDQTKLEQNFGIIGSEFSLSRDGIEYKGLQIDHVDKNKSKGCDGICPLVCGWDISKNETTIGLEASCYKVDKDSLVFRQSFIRNSDAISNLVIQFPIKVVSLGLRYVKKLDDLNEKSVKLNISTLDGLSFKIENLDNRSHLSLLNGQHGLALEFWVNKDVDIDKLLAGTKISYSQWYYESLIRGEVANKGLDFDIVEFE